MWLSVELLFSFWRIFLFNTNELASPFDTVLLPVWVHFCIFPAMSGKHGCLGFIQPLTRLEDHCWNCWHLFLKKPLTASIPSQRASLLLIRYCWGPGSCRQLQCSEFMNSITTSLPDNVIFQNYSLCSSSYIHPILCFLKVEGTYPGNKRAQGKINHNESQGKMTDINYIHVSSCQT